MVFGGRTEPNNKDYFGVFQTRFLGGVAAKVAKFLAKKT